MKVIIYARISTDDQDQDNERQIIKDKQYCALHNHEVLGIFQDEGVTGDSDPFLREGFKSGLALNPEGVVSFSMDRITRQHPAKVMQFLNQCKDRGLKIISVTEPMFNMEGEFADLLQYFLAWWNNYFLKKLKRDIQAGMEKAKLKGTKSGKAIGRPTVEFNKYRAYHLLNQGMSQRNVAKELGTSLATINRFKRDAMKNPAAYINEPSDTKPLGSETSDKV